MLVFGTIIWVLAIASLTWWDEDRSSQYLAMALPTYLIRLQIFNIPTTWLELAIYAVVTIWLIKTWRRGKLPSWRGFKDYQWPLGLLAVGLIIGTIFSANPIESLGIIKGWFFDPLLIFFLITNSRNHPKIEFNNLVFGLWVSGTVLAIAAVGQVVTGHYITVDQRASAWFGSANYLSLYLVPIMILVLGWWREIKLCYSQWIIAGGWLLMLVALYFTYSYAGWLALLAALTVWFWLISKYKYWLIGLGLGMAGLIASQWHLPKFQQMLDLAGRSSSHARLETWQTALLMIKEQWLSGIGLGQFEQRYPEFASRLFHPPVQLVMLHAHNIFLSFWLNVGLIGLAGFLGILVVFFTKIVRGWWQRHDLMLLGVGVTMIAILAHGLLDTPYWKNDLAAVFWIVVALGALLSRETHGRENLPDRH